MNALLHLLSAIALLYAGNHIAVIHVDSTWISGAYDDADSDALVLSHGIARNDVSGLPSPRAGGMEPDVITVGGPPLPTVPGRRRPDIARVDARGPPPGRVGSRACRNTLLARLIRSPLDSRDSASQVAEMAVDT